MESSQHRSRVFQKVGECLYRYSSNRIYYARIKSDGKEIRRSLRTIDRDLAKRKLRELRDVALQLYVDPDVKYGGKKTGGIRIRPPGQVPVPRPVPVQGPAPIQEPELVQQPF